MIGKTIIDNLQIQKETRNSYRRDTYHLLELKCKIQKSYLVAPFRQADGVNRAKNTYSALKRFGSLKNAVCILIDK